MTPRELSALVAKHQQVLNAITEIMEVGRVSPIEGEALFLWLAGSSAGIRQASIRNDEWIKPAAFGWQFAAEHGGDALDESMK